jgi:cysteine desulfurase family protein (TIGR01976 family)
MTISVPTQTRGLTSEEQLVRSRFPGLQSGTAFLDGPAGAQVPRSVIDAVSGYLTNDNANAGGRFAASIRTDAIIAAARQIMADFLGCSAGEIGFGQNASTINVLLSRAALRELHAGDEIVVTTLDHDANIDPWLEGAREVGASVRFIGALDDTSLDMQELEASISDKTRIVAFPWACNATGTMTDVARISALAHKAGALAWVDATHYAPHGPIDVAAAGVDVLFCSAYKFFGPHVGVFYANHDLLERWRLGQVRATPSQPSAALMEPGTLPGESLAGLIAAAAYINSVGWDWITVHETRLGSAFLDMLPAGYDLHGLDRMEGRTATFALRPHTNLDFSVRGGGAQDRKRPFRAGRLA